jgi:transcriptional regulator of acetoin/glycerol metabolism
MPNSHSETYDDSASEHHPKAPRRVARLCLVLECERPTAGGESFELGDVDEVVFARGTERAVEREATLLRLKIPAKSLSTVHARLLRRSGEWAIEDAASKNGTMVNGARVQSAPLREGDTIEMGRTLFVFREISIAGETLAPAGAPRLATLVPELSRRYAEVAKVARSQIPIVITGESGTGKEVLARAVHAISGRSGPFVAVNCGALTSTLLEAQLFGHAKGAFSGAVRDEPGLIRAAHGGTLLLDEIGELPKASQAALLRVLQEKEVTPVGSSRAVPVDVRFVAATNRDLSSDIGSGAFRSDLFARLTGLSIELPPLRRRREDLGLLVAAILRSIRGLDLDRVTIDPAVGRILLAYDWPLNVRELEQVLTTSIVLADGGTIRREHLPPAFREAIESKPPTDEPEDLATVLKRSLREHRGNVAAVARALGKAPMQIHRWMRRFDIDPDSFRE